MNSAKIRLKHKYHEQVLADKLNKGLSARGSGELSRVL